MSTAYAAAGDSLREAEAALAAVSLKAAAVDRNLPAVDTRPTAADKRAPPAASSMVKARTTAFEMRWRRRRR